ncbi:MAG: hypothetical protein JEZ11_05625 [Desulfobacterales bacterium]|nr:hypothetical protein [Desulfobacterales bacterium]
MKALFQEIMDIEDVHGILFVSLRGNLVYEEFEKKSRAKPSGIDWSSLIKTFAGIREAELVFNNHRIFFRTTELGYVFVVMGWHAHIALVRLNCTQALPSYPFVPT